MKTTKFLQINLFFILTYFMICCEPSSKSDSPGIALYKTKGEYFGYVTVGVQNSEITRTWAYTQDKYKFIFENHDTVFRYRIKMANGYVLDCEANEKTDAFLNLTHKQYMLMESKYPGNTISLDTLKNHIIDYNPYTVFYRDENPKKFPFTEIEEIDTAEINKIIKENRIDQFFKRIK
jgi:hypothetical protein